MRLSIQTQSNVYGIRDAESIQNTPIIKYLQKVKQSFIIPVNRKIFTEHFINETNKRRWYRISRRIKQTLKETGFFPLTFSVFVMVKSLTVILGSDLISAVVSTMNGPNFSPQVSSVQYCWHIYRKQLKNNSYTCMHRFSPFRMQLLIFPHGITVKLTQLLEWIELLRF